jgi:hypothetical protein
MCRVILSRVACLAPARVALCRNALPGDKFSQNPISKEEKASGFDVIASLVSIEYGVYGCES